MGTERKEWSSKFFREPLPPLSTLVDIEVSLVINNTRSSPSILHTTRDQNSMMERHGNKAMAIDILHIFSGNKLY